MSRRMLRIELRTNVIGRAARADHAQPRSALAGRRPPPRTSNSTS